MEGSVGLFDADENGQSTSFHFHVCVGRGGGSYES